MVNVLNEFGFKYYKFDGIDFEVLNTRPQRTHSCYPDSIPDGFQVICSIRNPLSQLVSEYRYGPINDFANWLKKTLNSNQNFQCFNFKTRKPDYFVRMESMFEDYSKIPFINQSKYFQLGILKKVCQYKMNPHPFGKSNWKDYYNEELANLVSKTFPNHFSDYKYDLNSWK